MVEESVSRWDNTQTAILDGAIRCIYRHGFQKLTTRCIADEAGVNEVTIFRRFGTKAAVLDAVFEREAHSLASDIVHFSGNVEADLTAIVGTMWNVTKDRQSIIPVILMELPRNPELRQYAEHSLRAVGQLLEIIQQYQDQGQLKSGSPLMTFSALIGPLVFTTLIESILPQATDPFDAQLYVQRFLYGHGSSVIQKDTAK